MGGLLDALLDDSLLHPPVMQQNYYIALRTDGVDGSGTQDDPYNGYGDRDANQTRFDWAMSQIPAQSTVFIGPSDFSANPQRFFETRGYPNANGFKPKSGQRIVGAGQEVTVIKLKSHTATAENYVFGIPLTSPNPVFLEGFELSDLSLDCALPSGVTCAAGGVNVTGTHIYISRVKVKNWGSNSSSLVAKGISGGTNNSDLNAVPYDVVLADCYIDVPSINHTEAGVALSIEGIPNGTTMYYHEACVVRGCYVDGGYDPGDVSPKDVRGLVIRGARGAIVEDNRFYNCLYGGPYQGLGSYGDIMDLVVRGNYYYNCERGVLFTLYAAAPPSYPWKVRRAIFEDNIMDLSTGPVAHGFEFAVYGTGTETTFEVLVLRSNRIRGMDGNVLAADSKAIKVSGAKNVVLENNQIDVPDADDAMVLSGTVNRTIFNNRSSLGSFLAAFDLDTGLHLPELTTDAETVLYTL